MHPFALNEQQVSQVSGGATSFNFSPGPIRVVIINGVIYDEDEVPRTTDALHETGGVWPDYADQM